jgi:hypothetical protein
MLPSTSDEAALRRAVVTAPEDEHGRPDRATMIRRPVAVPSAMFIWNQSARAFRPRLWHDFGESHSEPEAGLHDRLPGRLGALPR